jgi:hypothetical protein
MNEFFGTTMPKLGFGLMRLPRLADGKTYDIELCEKMTDAFLAAGIALFRHRIRLRGKRGGHQALFLSSGTHARASSSPTR